MKTRQPDVNRTDRRTAPGDEARPGTPGAGENICRTCRGRGRLGRQQCPQCAGAGYVMTGIGGA